MTTTDLIISTYQILKYTPECITPYYFLNSTTLLYKYDYSTKNTTAASSKHGNCYNPDMNTDELDTTNTQQRLTSLHSHCVVLLFLLSRYFQSAPPNNTYDLIGSSLFKEYSRVNRINIIGSIHFNPFSYSGFKISSLHRGGKGDIQLHCCRK
jgi:hypothetical protein